MVRTAFATCAGNVLLLGVIAGCGAGDEARQSNRREPVLLELRAMAPGPWRRADAKPIEPLAALPERADASRPRLDVAPAPPGDRPSLRSEPGVVPVDPGALRLPGGPDLDESRPSGAAAPTRLLPPVSSGAASGLPVDAAPATAAAAESRLPATAVPRTPEMAAAAKRASQRVRHAFDLAIRGAHYSARKEIIAALHILAEAKDAAGQTRRHTVALAAGLAALGQTTIAGGTDRADERIARFHADAQYQLALAAGGESAGSMALFGLAKLATVRAANEPLHAQAHLDQAMTLYRAAMQADPANFCAASELAVLLVERGELPMARQLLIRSISISPHPVVWHNLAVVHARLGETQLASQAAARAQQSDTRGAAPAVEWLDPQAFAQTNAASEGQSPARPPGAPAPQVKPPVDLAKKGFADWLPWTGRR